MGISNRKSRRTAALAWLVGLWLLSLLLAACLAQPAQPTPAPTITIGVVNLLPGLDGVLDGFKAGMTELGYVEGEGVVYLYDGATGDPAGLDVAAQALMAQEVDLIVAITTPATLAAKHATAGTTIPVVFGPLNNPVENGVVQSLPAPGGNLTGVQGGVSEGRRLEWLTTLQPSTQQVYLPHNPDDPAVASALSRVRSAAESLGIELLLQEARTPEEALAAFETIPPEADAILILPDSIVASRFAEIVEAALAAKLPLSSPNTDGAQQGALMAYGSDFFEVGKQMARLADLILRGSNPADLPVETAEFFLTINLKTAEAIGLEIPDDILRQADQVIR